MLEELSKRTTNNLENDPKFHEEGAEYQHMTAALDARLQGRLAQLEAERKEKLDQLARVRMAEEHIAREQYIVSALLVVLVLVANLCRTASRNSRTTMYYKFSFV
jgi:hypothetical protein